MPEDSVVQFCQPDPDLRTVWPSDFMQAEGCRAYQILTKGNALIDAHEREALKRGAKFTLFGNISASNMLGSKTTVGDLLTLVSHDSGQIEHSWDLNH